MSKNSGGRGRAHYAVIAGLCASSASLFGKISSTSIATINGNEEESAETLFAVTVLWQVKKIYFYEKKKKKNPYNV